MLCLSFFLPGGSIRGDYLQKCLLVIEKDIRLASTYVWVYLGRAFKAVPRQKFPNKPTAAKGAEKAAPGWSQRLSQFAI